MISRVDFFGKLSNNPDPSLHKTCKLFASQRIIEFILGRPPSIIYPALSRMDLFGATRKNFKVVPVTVTYRALDHLLYLYAN